MGTVLVSSCAAARAEKASNVIESLVSSLTRHLLGRRVKLQLLIVYFNAVEVLSCSHTSRSMPDLREQKPVLPCTLPVNNPNLVPEVFSGRGGYSRVPCHGCGVQYDRREIEQYSHPYAIHVSRFTCPRGHLGEARRVWEPVKAAETE
jgi:hypothetical protein